MNDTKTNVTIILSRNKYPDGDAGSVRDFAFAKIYSELSYKVICIGLGNSIIRGEHEGIDFRNIYIEKNNIIDRIKSELGYKTRMKVILREVEKKYGSIDILHIVDIPFNSIGFLKRYAKKNNIKLIHDSVEWYSSCEFKYGKFSVAYILKNLLNKYVISKPFNVISISKFLETHFKCKGLRTVRIPVIMDIKNIKFNSKKVNDILQIIYAGSPANKDYLREIILGLSLLDKDKLQKVRLNVIGVNREQLIDVIGITSSDLAKLGDSIEIYGRVPREKVVKILEDMDFSVLVRPSTERYAMAGFPTKLVESLSSATPMICNITSDLGDYLIDKKNAIIVDGHTPEDVADGIKRALACDKESIREMKQFARKTAEEYFDYRRYIYQVKKLLEV